MARWAAVAGRSGEGFRESLPAVPLSYGHRLESRVRRTFTVNGARDHDEKVRSAGVHADDRNRLRPDQRGRSRAHPELDSREAALLAFVTNGVYPFLVRQSA